MNTENIKNAILSQAESGNAVIVEALMAVRDNFTDKFVGKFVADVIWTIFGGYQKYSKWRISEKQANVIAEFVATIPVKSLMANLTKEQFEALGFELTEEAKEVPAKTMETLKAMSCDDAEVAEIIAKVIETGKITKSQAFAISKYIASHKGSEAEKAEEKTETTVAESATVEDTASSEVVGNQDEQTEEGKVSEAETLATSTSEEKTFSDYEELRNAVSCGVWVSNGDAAVIEGDLIDDITNEIWEVTENGKYGLSEVTDPIEIEDAKILLDLENAPVEHIYTYNVGCVKSYIVFAGDWDYCEAAEDEPKKKASRAHIVSI